MVDEDVAMKISQIKLLLTFFQTMLLAILRSVCVIEIWRANSLASEK